jgi:hypothetical protein
VLLSNRHTKHQKGSVEARLKEQPILHALFPLALRSYRREKEDKEKVPTKKTSSLYDQIAPARQKAITVQACAKSEPFQATHSIQICYTKNARIHRQDKIHLIEVSKRILSQQLLRKRKEEEGFSNTVLCCSQRYILISPNTITIS